MPQARSPRLPGTVIALTPGTLRGGRGFEGIAMALERAVGAAVQGGLRSLVLREPFLADGEMLALGLRLAAVLRSATGDGPAWFGIHDRVHLAGALDADGAHLGGRSLPPQVAREVLAGSSVALGISTHAADDTNAAQGADYVFHSPVFQPRSKENGGGPPIGIDALCAFAASTQEKVWGLGGIDPVGIRSLPRDPSVAGVALIGSLWGTDESPLERGRPGPLGDLAGIQGRAGAIAKAAAEVFGDRSAPAS